eukprot:2065199-Prymnesium_polylepis.1
MPPKRKRISIESSDSEEEEPTPTRGAAGEEDTLQAQLDSAHATLLTLTGEHSASVRQEESSAVALLQAQKAH